MKHWNVVVKKKQEKNESKSQKRKRKEAEISGNEEGISLGEAEKERKKVL